MAEITQLRKGYSEEAGLPFSEIGFHYGQSEFWIIALDAGEVDYFFRSDKPLSSLAGQYDCDEGFEFTLVALNDGDEITTGVLQLSLEGLEAVMQSGEFELYEYARHDGSEGFSEMCESEYANAFLITCDFHALDFEPDGDSFRECMSRYNQLLNEAPEDLMQELGL